MIRRFRRPLVAALALLLGMAGVLVVASPAAASWHGTCDPYHNGNLCLYTGYNGGGSRVQYPGIVYGQPGSGCTNLGAGFADNLQSGVIDWTEAADVRLSVTYNCAGPYCVIDLTRGIPVYFDIDVSCGASFVDNIASFNPGFLIG